MSQTLHQSGIDRLSIPERLDLIGQIWDSISAAESEVSGPDWHQRELERRRAAAAADPGAGLPRGGSQGSPGESVMSILSRM